jgi:RNA polymerase sigma-70 factor (ECF subfamily)
VAVVSHEEDLRLVRRMLAGDTAAYESFAELYVQTLYRFTRNRLRDDGERTRDIVQTAITKALGRLDAYRGEAALLTWLCACCRNEVLMHFRSRRSAPVELELEEGMAPAAGFRGATAPDPERSVLRDETATLVHMTLDLLPSHYAQALEWKYVEGLPGEEIAGRLGTTAKAAESLLTRAREAFRTRYWSVAAAGGAAGDEPTEEGTSDGRARAGA